MYVYVHYELNRMMMIAASHHYQKLTCQHYMQHLLSTSKCHQQYIYSTSTGDCIGKHLSICTHELSSSTILQCTNSVCSASSAMQRRATIIHTVIVSPVVFSMTVIQFHLGCTDKCRYTHTHMRKLTRLTAALLLLCVCTLCYCRAESDEVKKNVPTSEVDCGMFAVDTAGVRTLLLAKVQHMPLLLTHIAWSMQ
jgi:hypothetical protein